MYAVPTVPPFVGVWFETLYCFPGPIQVMSHPSWVCGLKHQWVKHKQHNHYVTPFVGVWIETSSVCEETIDEAVTPFVGVWIETE